MRGTIPSSALLVASAIVNVVLPNPFDNTWHGYKEVRSGAHMFWWFHKADASDYTTKPLVIWIQGGPAESGEIGYFFEFGKYNEKMETRVNYWEQHANILIFDSPVGTGFSYVDNKNKLATTVSTTVNDLYTLIVHLYTTYPAWRVRMGFLQL
ncbi:retinoid-inducible serine carboxypeptidase-like [Tubulanus polymorphus]|uniref:retinoid-inducible serine carboxypeptidase-like n=1 Tax=Tubulanus polymorphus TaxID=672921 RepID=UPI003DA5AA0A